MATMRASMVSAPTLRACMTKLPLLLSVPPVTVAPAVFSTGTGSPVSSDSSTVDWPSSTMPSTGTDSPGRTRSLSPTWTVSSGTSVSLPSAAIRRAVFGARFSSARMALPVFSRARSSSTCPSSTSTMMTAAASK